VSRNVAVGLTVLTVQAVDADVGLNAKVEYLIYFDDDDLNQMSSDHYFHLNRSSGALTVARPLDFEHISTFTLDVVAKDCGLAGSRNKAPLWPSSGQELWPL